MLTIQLSKLLNLSLNLRADNDSSTLIKELFNLLNILIHPQKLRVQPSSSRGQDEMYESQQEKVRDIILYLKIIKQVLKLQDEKDLFTLSDVIDDSNLNSQSLIYHFMVIYERIVGKQMNKISHISAYEVLELQRDLEPFIQSQNLQHIQPNNFQDQNTQQKNQEQQVSSQDLKALETSYQSNLKKLEDKLKAYKQEYVKVKLQSKQHEKMIQKYEEVFKKIGQRKESKQKEQEIKTKIYERFLTQMKSQYETELSKLQQKTTKKDPKTQLKGTNGQQYHNFGHMKSEQQLIENDFERLRSVSPLTPKLNQNSQHIQSISLSRDNSSVQTERNIHARSVQTNIDPRITELEELQLQTKKLIKERDSLANEKKDLLLEKQKFSEKYSVLQQKYDSVLEELDDKTQKYENKKKELKRIQDEGGNNEVGTERLKEEIAVLQRAKEEAETRTKKFESQFRSALKEVDELREQLETLKNSQKQQLDRDEVFNNSAESSSFNIFNSSSQHQLDVKLQEIEKEKDFLLQKIQMLEKSNKELIIYKKSIEETLNEISKEEDPEKKISMINVNLIRRKSLLRLEQIQARDNRNENKVVSPDDSPDRSQNAFIGLRQSVFNQFMPGAKHSLLAPPSQVMFDNNNQNSGYSSGNNPNNRSQNDLDAILDQIDSRAPTPTRIEEQKQQPLLNNFQQKDDQDLLLNKSQENIPVLNTNNITKTDQTVKNLFGIAPDDKKDLLSKFLNKNPNTKPKPNPNNDNGAQQQLPVPNPSGQTLFGSGHQSLNNSHQNISNSQIHSHQQDDLDESEEEDEDAKDKSNFLLQKLKQNAAKQILENAIKAHHPNAIQKDIQKQVIKEANEDEYDDEEESSSSEDPEYD